MEIKPAAGLRHWLNIYPLYRSAFPKSERKPFSIIRKNQKTGKSDIWYFEENGVFAGLATTVNGDNGMVLLDYFAVSKKHRDQGWGSRMLPLILQQYEGRRLFGEIELVDETADNYNLCNRRKQFYLRLGLTALGVKVKLFGVDMELMSNGCQISFAEYLEFYRRNIGEFALKHVFELK